MNRILQKALAFTAALLMVQTAVPMSGIAAIGSGAGDEVLTTYTDSAWFAHRSGKNGYFFTESGKSQAEFSEGGKLNLSWDTDTGITAGINARLGSESLSLEKLPLKKYYDINSSYSLRMHDVSGFAAYGTNFQFCKDGDSRLKEVLIADGYTEENFPYDITPQTFRTGNDEYKIYQYTEEVKMEDYDFEHLVYLAVPSENSYHDGQLLHGCREGVGVVDSLIEAGIVSSDEFLESAGFGMIIAADENHKSAGSAELIESQSAINSLEYAYSESVNINMDYSFLNFKKGSGDAYLFPYGGRYGYNEAYKCIWDTDDEVSVEKGTKIFNSITPLTEAKITFGYDADIRIDRGGFMFGAMCRLEETNSLHSAADDIRSVFIADVYSGPDTDSLQSYGPVTCDGMEYEIYSGKDGILYAVVSEDRFADRGSSYYSGSINVLGVLRSVAEAGYIDGDVRIDSVCFEFSALPGKSEEAAGVKAAAGSINVTRHEIYEYKSILPGHGDSDPRFECLYSAGRKSGRYKVPSSFTVTWENESSASMVYQRKFNTENGWDEYGNLTAEYDVVYTGCDNAESSFGIFGETYTENNQLKDQFYIMEGWDNYNPMAGIKESGTSVETIEVDGVEYDVFYLPYNESLPAFRIGGTYCCVRRENLTDSDHRAVIKKSISLEKFFEAWRKLGFTDGATCETGLWLTEGGAKKVEFTVNSFDLYGSNEKAKTVMGDADGDGIVNTMDYVTLVGYLTGILINENGEIDSADMNSDGTVNVVDLILLKKMLQG